MSKNAKIGLTIAIIVILGITVYLLFFKDNAQQTAAKAILDLNTKAKDEIAKVKELPGGGTIKSSSGEFPLQIGSKGDTVKNLQIILKAQYGQNITADGSFGPATQNALKAVNPAYYPVSGDILYLLANHNSSTIKTVYTDPSEWDKIKVTLGI